MALPIQQSATYNVTIPSTEKTIHFRPFLVKEQKALLLAQQSEDPDVMVNTIKDIITSCVKEKIDVDDLAVFDLEFMFSQIRAKSVGETVDLIFRCGYCEDEKAKVKISIDLTQLQVEKNSEHTTKIELFDDVGVVMKYPGLRTLQALTQSTQPDEIDTVFELMASCIDYVFDSNQVYPAAEQTTEELVQFLENLTQDHFVKVQRFFETMPQLKKEIKFKCPVCEKENKSVLSGLDDFF